MEPKKKPTTERKMKTLPQNSTIRELSYRISDLPDVRYGTISLLLPLTRLFLLSVFYQQESSRNILWILIRLCVHHVDSVKSFTARHCSGSAFAACERRTARVLALKLGPPEDSPWISSSNEIPRPDLLFTSSFSTCTYRHV